MEIMTLIKVKARGSEAGGRRNLIINGSMQVAQRPGGDTPTTSSGYYVDMFTVNPANLDNLTFTQAQVADAPAGTGLKKSLKFTVTAAETAVASDEFIRIYHAVEGKNVQRFEWGTSSAKEVTLSFYVKSSITGTFACSIYIFDANVIMNKPYTINSANTWERKTVTFPAYTAGGSAVPTDDQTAGIYINFGLLAGSSYNTQINDWTAYGSGANLLGGQTANVGAVNGTTWQLTGVQLEVGSAATDFEQLTFAEELQLCQRYYTQITHNANDVIRGGYGLTAEYWQVQLPVQMRAAPSSSLKSGTVAYSNCSSFLYYTNANNTTNNTVTAFVDPNDNTYFYLYPTSAADLVWQFIAEM